MSNTPKRNTPSVTTDTGGNPARASNARLMAGIDQPDRLSAGKSVPGADGSSGGSPDRYSGGMKLRKISEFVLPALVKLNLEQAKTACAEFDRRLARSVQFKLALPQQPVVPGTENPSAGTNPAPAQGGAPLPSQMFPDKAQADVQIQQLTGGAGQAPGAQPPAPAGGQPAPGQPPAPPAQEPLPSAKTAGVDNEPALADHPSAPDKQYRPRSELIIADATGCYAIDKGDYILFPGGGVADGETPRDAALRETLEESGRCPINVREHGVVEATWPSGKNEFWDNSEFDGERTYFYAARDGGDSKLSHPDREEFKVIPFDDLESRLKELIDDPDQSWAKANNEARLRAVSGLRSAEGPIKLADVATILRKPDVMLFTPDGKLVVQRRPNRRLGFYHDPRGARQAPYEDPIRFVPEGGVPDPGVHGYDVTPYLGDTDQVPEGFETLDPQEALKELYASMGLAVNKPYRQIDRARARVILRALKRRAARVA